MARLNLNPFIFIALFGITHADLGFASAIDTIQGNSTTFGSIQSSNKSALSFLTGSNGPYHFTDLKFDLLNFSDPNSFSFNVDLFAVGSSPDYFPTGSSLAQATLSTGPMADSTSAVLDFTTLDALGSYGLAANTGYALVLSGATPSVAGGVLAWKAGGSGVVTGDGFSLLQGFNFNNGSWFTLSDPLRLSMQVGNAAVPEPASIGLLGLGLALMALAKPRKIDKI